MKGFEPSKPSAWEADALPTELHSQKHSLVGLAGLEPATFGLEMLLRFELKSP